MIPEIVGELPAGREYLVFELAEDEDEPYLYRHGSPFRTEEEGLEDLRYKQEHYARSR